MRLRLRIERNELPPVCVLWAIEPTAIKQTVAQFLQRVDERVPLEGESWGLEDYSVTIGGYEALHFSEVGDCFQNEDEVVIKPLQLVDVRARRVTGREQISSDGRHLLDGVPFGKPLLKRPRRPEVPIPPRKRQKVEELDIEAQELGLSRLAELEEGSEDEEDEDDSDFEEPADEDEDEDEKESEDEDEENEKESESEGDQGETNALSVALRRSRRQRINIDEEESEDEDAEDDSSDDSSDTSDDDSDTSDDDSDASSDDSDDATSEESWNGIETSPTKPSAPLVNGNHSNTLSTKVPEPPSALTFFSPPFEGAQHTKSRNIRRREQRKLRHLKEAGVLPSDATMQTMQKWQEEQGISNNSEVKKAAQDLKANKTQVVAMEIARQRLIDQIDAGGVDVDSVTEQQHVSKKRKVLVGGDQDTFEVPAEKELVEENEQPDEEPSTRPKIVLEELNGETTSDFPSSRRARIDLASTNRLVFGSLGVRTPRTQSDKDALQKKLSARASRNVASKGSDPAIPQLDERNDSEAWHEKIELSAVECCDEDVSLSTPPFPFQQRWDPQYQYSKKRKRSSKGKNNVNGTANGYVESYDKYNKDGGGDALDYDDHDEEDEDFDSYWEDGALLGDDLDGDEDDTVDDGFPSLPDDLHVLSNLAEADAVEGDYVAYKQLICSSATNWTPTTVDRTVRLGSKAEDSRWNITFAMRDKRPKQYDDEGNRIYSKFEMEGLSDDEDEDEEQTLGWSELQEPKLLKRPAVE